MLLNLFMASLIIIPMFLDFGADLLNTRSIGLNFLPSCLHVSVVFFQSLKSVPVLLVLLNYCILQFQLNLDLPFFFWCFYTTFYKRTTMINALFE